MSACGLQGKCVPIREDTRAILRTKTILGETYGADAAGREAGSDPAPARGDVPGQVGRGYAA